MSESNLTFVSRGTIITSGNYELVDNNGDYLSFEGPESPIIFNNNFPLTTNNNGNV